MNLLFGTVLLFILISPGLIFRFSYLQGTYAKLTFRVSAFEEIFWALIPAFLFQFLAVLFLQTVLNENVRLDILYGLITGNDSVDFAVIEKNVGPFLLYNLVIGTGSAGLGVLAREAVRKYKLDLRFKFLRFGNEWHYLFSGEGFFQRNPGAPGIFLIQVDVMVDSSEGTMIYSGILEDYYLSKDNGLDRLYLHNVYRRRLKDDLNPDQPNVGYLERHLDPRYYAMPGDLFVITYDKILNLNITYYVAEGNANDEPEER